MKEEFKEFDVASIEPLTEGQQTSFEKAMESVTVEELKELKLQQAEGDKPSSIESEETAPTYFGHRTESATFNPKKEQPHHRAICIQLAQGYTPKEVSEMTGFTTVTINYVRQQPWALKYIAELQQKAGRKAVMNELQGAALDAARFLVQSVKGEIDTQKTADRSKDAWKLLERCYGTVPQTVIHGNIDPTDLSDEELATCVTGNNK